MGITSLLQDEGDWSVPLLPDTPWSVVGAAVDIRTYAFASIVITPGHWNPGDLSDADLLGVAFWTGPYLAQTDSLLTLEGAGNIWWLGQENDNGDMYAGVDTTSAGLDLEDQLDARIFTNFANGLTKGSVNSSATTRTIKLPGNLTRRQLLDTICAKYVSGGYEWRVNPDFSVDVDTQGNLYATTASPTCILTSEGGRDGNITGLWADLEVGSVDVEDYRTDIEARWNEATPGTNNGVASNSPPAGWKDPSGATPVLRTVINYNHRTPFRHQEKQRRSDRVNAAHYAVDVVNATAQATNLATAYANQTNSYQIEVQASIDEYDPLRFLQTGDSVWVYDLDLGLVDTANEVYYRGSAVHPQKLRVQAISTPIQEGYGVYLRYWDGAAFQLYDLTPYVDWEEGETTLELGTRSRFHRKNARPRRFNRARLRRQARRQYMIQQYVEAVS